MSESFTSRFFNQEKKNQEQQAYYTEFNSSEYIPENFGVGGVTSKVLEEIYEEQDEWELFFSNMFFLGIFLIPVQLIFADDIKPYDAYMMESIQKFIFSFHTIEKLLGAIVVILDFCANVRFLCSITIFFYLCFDPGVAYKTALIAGSGSYIVFILKLIIHDARPFWIYENIQPHLCRLSFGCPSLDVFVGMLYSQYIYFCTNRALKSGDPIIAKNLSSIKVSEYISLCLIIINVMVGVSYTILGENFIYQICITFFYGFIFIRIIIIFNKDIDHFSNGSRFIVSISNVTSILVMFAVTTLAILSCIIYEIVNQDLLISREWTMNISQHCANTNENTGISIRLTFLDSATIFHILGATLGVNLVLKHIDNPFYWFVTDWKTRLARGITGFIVNSIIIGATKYVRFKVITAEYVAYSFLYGIAGYICYGVIPLAFCWVGFTNKDYQEKKKEKLIQKPKMLYNEENNFGEIAENEKEEDRYLSH